MVDIPDRVLQRLQRNQASDGRALYATDDNGCWIWQLALNANGYGVTGWQIGGNIEHQLAHRVTYIAAGHTIPEGYEIDHLCRVRACVNPSHLEAVTGEENNRRAGNAPQTHCIRGHLMDETNVRLYQGTRICRACRRARSQERKARGVHWSKR